MEPKSDEYYLEKIDGMPLVTDGTKRTYKTNLKRMIGHERKFKEDVEGMKRLNTGSSTIHELLMNPERTIEGLTTLENLNTRISLYIAIITCMRASGLKKKEKGVYNTFYKAMMIARREQNESLHRHIPTDRQKKCKYEWSDVLKIRDSYPIDSPEHVLLGIYTYVPPRRQEDYARMRLYTDINDVPKQDHNLFHLNHPKHGAYMYVKDFKTAKVMGSFFNKKIPDKLVKVLKASLKVNPREYVFVNRYGEPFESVNAYTKYSNNMLKKIFDNKYMSVNALRHSHATYINDKNADIGERYQAARSMGHGIKKDLIYAFKDGDRVLMKLPKPENSQESEESSKKSKKIRREQCYRLNPETRQLEVIPCPPRFRFKSSSRGL